MADTEYPKTAGDYAVEIEEKIASNNAGMAQPVIAEMKAALPPPVEGESVATAPPPPAPTDKGLAAYVDLLQAAADTNNVVAMRSLCEEMKAVAPPTAPAEPAPA